MGSEKLEFKEVHINRSGIFIGIKRVLHQKRSRFQEITVYETEAFGKMLTLDGMIMVTERDEYLYHEMLVHPAMLLTPKVEHVLVIGGGDGGTTREILRYPDVLNIKVVELDPEVVDISKGFFPNLAESLEHPKVDILFMDGVEFLKNTNNKFDVIIVDSPDPVGHAETLFTEMFYSLVRKRLNPTGTLVAQTESPFYHLHLIKKVNRMLRDIFPWVKVYIGPVLTYPSGTWSYTIARQTTETKTYRKLPKNLKWFTKDMLKGLFLIPELLKDVQD